MQIKNNYFLTTKVVKILKGSANGSWQGGTEIVAHALLVGMHIGMTLWKAVLQEFCKSRFLKISLSRVNLKNLYPLTYRF